MNGKYIVNVKREHQNNALSKAKEDITFFSKQVGFTEISLEIPKKKIGLIKQIFNFQKNKFNENDIVIIQYPTDMGRIYDKYLLNRLINKHIFRVAIVHDVDSLRFKNSRYKTLKKEIAVLNKFNLVVCPNNCMERVLVNNGLTVNTIIQEIYDYLATETFELKYNVDEYKKIVNYAGNLKKSKFISKMEINEKNKYFFFGDITDLTTISDNCVYKGSFTPEEIMNELLPGFGLIWDGESTSSIEGMIGEYLQYNSPHKLSLYISSGLPVIIWRKAAMSNFVEERNIGITIDKLEDIKDKLSRISDEEFKRMIENAQNESVRLRNGYYIKRILNSIERIVGDKDAIS